MEQVPQQTGPSMLQTSFNLQDLEMYYFQDGKLPTVKNWKNSAARLAIRWPSFVFEGFFKLLLTNGILISTFSCLSNAEGAAVLDWALMQYRMMLFSSIGPSRSCSSVSSLATIAAVARSHHLHLGSPRQGHSLYFTFPLFYMGIPYMDTVCFDHIHCPHCLSSNFSPFPTSFPS